MKSAYNQARTILVTGSSLSSLQAALNNYRAFVQNKIDSASSSKFVNSAQMDEYVGSWDRALRDVNALLSQSNQLMHQIDAEVRRESE